MINAITIKNLFGFYDYHITLKGSVTIIHGPNGCGKTTVLKMLYYLFEGKLTQLYRIEFDELGVLLDKDTFLKISRERKLISKNPSQKRFIDNETDINRYITNYELRIGSDKPICFSSRDAVLEFVNSNWSDIDPRGRFGRIIPYMERIAESKWIDRRINRTMTTEEFIDEYYDVIIDSLPRMARIQIEVPKEIQQVLDTVKVQFISADRLKVEKKEKRNSYSDETTTIESRVSICANGIAERIKTALQDYATFSQAKDRSFPIRVIEDREILTVDQIKEKLVALEDRRKRYIDIGILDNEGEEISTERFMSSITEDTRQTLSLYAKDTEEKLNVIDGLSSLISLYKGLLDKKFSNKEIVFNKDKGFSFKLTHTGAALNATTLSSGEQQELVLLYDMIFNTDKNTLILIDEPELSLHIKWQLEFIDDLFEIIEKRGFTALIATHSPQIIDDRWDLTLSLSE